MLIHNFENINSATSAFKRTDKFRRGSIRHVASTDKNEFKNTAAMKI